MVRALTREYKDRKVTKSSETFEKNYSKLLTSGKLSVANFYDKFKGSAEYHFEDVTSTQYESKNYLNIEETYASDFNPDFLQLLRKTKTQVTINGSTATSTKIELINSIPTSKPLSRKDRIKLAEDDIKYEFGNLNGTIYKNKYHQKTCI